MRSRSAIDRYLPLAHFGLAIALVALLFPTALRPPSDRPPPSARLSPDAPPDDEQPLITSLSMGRSGVASGLAGAGPAEDGLGVQPAVGTRPRACPRGVGNPPRQTESIYAPPCAPAFVGDNGGATWKGVTATEVRVAQQGLYLTNPSTSGYVGDGPQDGENDVDRTLRVLQVYFNRSLQLWGRQLRIYRLSLGNTSDQSQRAAAQRADEEFKVFAAGLSTPSGCDEYAQRKLVAFCGIMPRSWFEAHAPQNWSWYMEGTELTRFAAEYICKKLSGKPAAFAGDPLLQQTARRIGVIYYDGPNNATDGFSAFYGPTARELVQNTRETCGEELVTVAFSNDSSDSQATFATAIARFRADGVTTVVPLMDWVASLQLTNVAQSNGYIPEWLVVGAGALDRNQLGQFQNQTEWAHAFGITSLEMERPFATTDCYRAYKSVDPDNVPQFAICNYAYQTLGMLVTAIQLAGPRLTPQTLQAGLLKMGYRFPDRPVWAIGGGYAPGVWSYTHNVAEIWYDPAATDPTGNSNQPGAYRYVRAGKRYRLGELPREDPLVFSDGVTTTEDSDTPG